MQHFASALRPAQQTTHSLRASQYRNANKPKRDEGSEERPDAPEDAARASAANTQPFASSYPPEAAQLRVAGLLPGDADEVPAPPFPHSAATTPGHHLTHTKVQYEIASLTPAIYAADTPKSSHAVGKSTERSALRSTHLDVLTTIMHRCILEGDYHRAARAWGMILRTQVAGRSLDPRNYARWGIGAELLLRRQPHNPSHYIQNENNQISIAHEEQFPPAADGHYTQEGFELGREYYERLIVQYPHRKAAPDAIDSRTFYPPMFSIWILSVLEQSRQAREQYQEEGRRSAFVSNATEDGKNTASKDARLHEAMIQADELARAQEICERLDQLVVSPPFDKQAELLILRGNVGLWISDLVIGSAVPLRHNNDWDVDAEEDDYNDNLEPTLENRKKHTHGMRELERAQEFFNRAEMNGSKNLRRVMTSIEVKMKSLTKQMARLSE